MGYRNNILSGLSWFTIFKVGIQVLGYIKLYFLINIFTPEQYGQIGVVLLLLAFLETATEGGIFALVIQEGTQFLEEKKQSLFTFSALRGLAIAALMLIVTPIISTIFDQPNLLWLVTIIALTPILKGLQPPELLSWQQKLEFHKEVWLKLTVQLITVLVTILLALTTQSITAIPWGITIGALFQLIISYSIYPQLPLIRFIWADQKLIISRGKWLASAGIFNYAFHQGDDWVVTKLLGNSALGLYQMAYKCSAVVVLEIADIFNRTLFPVYAKIQAEPVRLRRAYLQSTSLIAALSVALAGVLALVGPWFIRYHTRPEWEAMIPAFYALLIFGVIRSISGSASSLFLATKKQSYVHWLTLISTISMFIAIVPLVNQFGIVGAAYAATIGALAAIPYIIYGVHQVLNTHGKPTILSPRS